MFAGPCSPPSASHFGLAPAGLLQAQDARQRLGAERAPACVVLEARLAAPAGVLSEESERSPDTSRIQGAIDGCAPGRAVVLARAGGKDVFLAGPLRLRTGVTLVVAERTALFASRNPRDYDVEPGSCGVLRPVGRSAVRAAGRCSSPRTLPAAALMGPGAIDGRGGAKMTRRRSQLVGDRQAGEDPRPAAELSARCSSSAARTASCCTGSRSATPPTSTWSPSRRTASRPGASGSGRRRRRATRTASILPPPRTSRSPTASSTPATTTWRSSRARPAGRRRSRSRTTTSTPATACRSAAGRAAA